MELLKYGAVLQNILFTLLFASATFSPQSCPESGLLFERRRERREGKVTRETQQATVSVSSLLHLLVRTPASAIRGLHLLSRLLEIASTLSSGWMFSHL